MRPLARRLLVLAAVLPLSMPASTAVGQLAENDQSSLLPKYFNLDFPGGTLEQFASAVRRANEDATMVISQEALAFRLPAVTLRQVDVSAAARLIESVARSPVSPSVTLDVNWVEIPASANVAVSIDVWTSPDRAQAGTKTWSVREHLNRGLPADDLLSAIQAMLEVEPGASDVRFHEPTALLIIRGSTRQLGLVNEGLGQLRAEVRGSANQVETLRVEIRDLERDLAQAEAEMRIASKAVEVAQIRVRQTAKYIEQNMADEVGLAEAELDVVRSEAEMQMIMRRVDALVTEIERLRARLDG